MMLEDLQRGERVGRNLLLIDLPLALLALWITGVAGGGNFDIQVWLIVCLLPFSALAWIHQSLERRSREEEFEKREWQARNKSSSLFTDEAENLLSAAVKLRQFEKFVLPAFTLLLAAGLTYVSYVAWEGWLRPGQLTAEVLDGQRSLYGIQTLLAFYFFVSGRYTSGLARNEAWRHLRAAGHFRQLATLAAVTGLAELVSLHFGLGTVQRLAHVLLPILVGLVAVELVLNLLMELYRPRRPHEHNPPACDSRFLGLIADHSELLKSFAHTLDYQFGIRVSDTWFYRFLASRMLLLVAFQLITLYAMSCLYMLDTGERAVLERFGKPRPGVAGPGLHVKLPWPIDRVIRVDYDRIREIHLGGAADEKGKVNSDTKGPKVYLWTKSHGTNEEFFMMAGPDTSKSEGDTAPVDLISGEFTLHYAVNDVRDYVYTHLDPHRWLMQTGYSEITKTLAGFEMAWILQAGRQQVADTVKKRLQKACDEMKLGIEIVFFGMEGIHPPIQAIGPSSMGPPSEAQTIGHAFEKVMGAMQEKHTRVLRAVGYQKTQLALAEGLAAEMLARSRAAAVESLSAATADAKSFSNRQLAYALAPEVYRQRLYLDILGQSLANARKILLPATDGREVTIFNWEEKLSTDLLDIDLSAKDEN